MRRSDHPRYHLAHLFREAADRDPDTPFVVDKPFDIAPQAGTDLSVGNVARLVETYAGQLYQAGVRHGDRVAVHKSDNADILVVACALSRVGAVPVLLSSRLPVDVAHRLIARAAPHHVLTDATMLAAGAFTEQWAPDALLVAGVYRDLVSVADLPPAPVPDLGSVDPDAPLMVTHTSGTTREPKLVEQTHRGLAAHFMTALRLLAATRVRERWALCVSPVHIRAYAALALALNRAMPLAVLVNHDADAVAEVFSRFRPGLVEAHPNTFVHWESLAEHPDRPLNTVRMFLSTFDAIHPRTVRVLLAATRRRLPMYTQAYGQTETGPVTTRYYSCRGAARIDGRCVGHPLPGVRVRVRDSRDGRGRIVVRTRGRAATYVGEEQLFAEQLDGEWWHTGDLGYRTRWGCLHLLDREIDHIDGVGSVLAIEDMLMSRLPRLREVVLVPIDGRSIQPVVCTKGDEPLDPAAWFAAVRDLPSMSDPLRCAWDDLPQTATAKIKRRELRTVLRDGRLPPFGAFSPSHMTPSQATSSHQTIGES